MAHHRAAALFSSAVKRVNLVANCNSVPALLDTLDSTRPATCQMLSGFPLKISYETPTLCTTVGKRKPAAGWQTNGNPDTENTQLLCTEVLPSFCASQHHCTPCTTAKLIMAELNRKYLKALSSSFSVRTLILSRMVHVPSLTAGLWPKDTQVIWLCLLWTRSVCGHSKQVRDMALRKSSKGTFCQPYSVLKEGNL